jgi:outer membrane receptor for ferric coprogen and ferric-rhodotorulic acid
MRKWLWATLTVSAVGAGFPQVATGVDHPAIRAKRARVVYQPSTAAPPLTAEGGEYYVPYITGPGGERTPIMNIPASVTVVPRQLMDDQQTTTICGALQNVSGVICR